MPPKSSKDPDAGSGYESTGTVTSINTRRRPSGPIFDRIDNPERLLRRHHSNPNLPHPRSHSRSHSQQQYPIRLPSLSSNPSSGLSSLSDSYNQPPEPYDGSPLPSPSHNMVPQATGIDHPLLDVSQTMRDLSINEAIVPSSSSSHPNLGPTDRIFTFDPRDDSRRASSIHQDSTPDPITESEHPIGHNRKRELLSPAQEHTHQDKKRFVNDPSQSPSPSHIPSPDRRVGEDTPQNEPQQPVPNDGVSTILEMLRSMQAQLHQTNQRVDNFIELRSRSSSRRSRSRRDHSEPSVGPQPSQVSNSVSNSLVEPMSNSPIEPNQTNSAREPLARTAAETIEDALSPTREERERRAGLILYPDPSFAKYTFRKGTTLYPKSAEQEQRLAIEAPRYPDPFQTIHQNRPVVNMVRQLEPQPGRYYGPDHRIYAELQTPEHPEYHYPFNKPPDVPPGYQGFWRLSVENPPRWEFIGDLSPEEAARREAEVLHYRQRHQQPRPADEHSDQQHRRSPTQSRPQQQTQTQDDHRPSP